MKPFDNETTEVCRNVQEQLSDYLENTLTARQMVEIEKHLTACQECAAHTRQMQATVQLLRAAPRRDTADDFMAKLHARLDDLEPEALRPRSPWERLRERIGGIRALLSARRGPALGLSMAMVAAVALVLYRAGDAPTVTEEPPVAMLQHNVALTASNPFDDPVAANLEAQFTLDADKDSPDSDHEM